LGVLIKQGYRLEAKGQFATSPGLSELKYKFDATEYITSNVFVMVAGFRYVKENKICETLIFDAGAELNMGMIKTNIEDPNKKPNQYDSDEFGKHTLNTIDFGLGVGIKKLLWDRSSVGIEIYVHVNRMT